MLLVLSKSAVHANSPLVSVQSQELLSVYGGKWREKNFMYFLFSTNLSTDAVWVGHLGPHLSVEHTLGRDVHIGPGSQGPGYAAHIDSAVSIAVTVL